MNQEAIAEYRRAVELDSYPFNKGYLGFVLAKSGQRDEASKIVNQLKQESAQNYVPNYAVALPYIELGNKDEAFILA